MFGTASALAKPGFMFVNGQLHKQTVEEFTTFVHEDTQRCANWFTKVFGYVPATYAAPFNQWSLALTTAVTALGVTERYGDERLDVDNNYTEIVNARRD